MFKLIIIGLISLLVHAGEPVNVAVPTYRGYSDKDAPGYLNELLNSMQIDGIRYHFVPLKRAAQDYFQKKYDCFVGMSPKIMSVYGLQSTDKIFSESYLTLTAKLLVKENKDCSLKSMKGKTVLALEGFPVEQFFKEVKIEKAMHVRGLRQSYKMLKSGRVDGLIAFFPSSIHEMYSLKECHSFFSSKESLQCWRSPKNVKAISKFNDKLNSLKSSGKLTKIKSNLYPQDRNSN